MFISLKKEFLSFAVDFSQRIHQGTSAKRFNPLSAFLHYWELNQSVLVLKGRPILAQGKWRRNVALGWSMELKIVRAVTFIKEKILFRTNEITFCFPETMFCPHAPARLHHVALFNFIKEQALPLVAAIAQTRGNFGAEQGGNKRPIAESFVWYLSSNNLSSI